MVNPANVRAAALMGSLGVLCGAFGAHGLKGKVDDKMFKAWETAAHYQLVHSVALLAIPAKRYGHLTTGLFTAGIVLFSGSIYAMVLTNEKKLGIVTPIGGLALVAGWLSLFL